MKVIAMYLPQFHRVKENDEWWGEGFTEWTSVKAAKPLFEGHNQPVVPYKENYYDLTEKAVMQWQADLMKQYGVDGVCMYHYWFKDGRQILEKPAENLLQWTDIDMPFCFCWANETWARTWSVGDNVNVWTSVLEKENRLESSSVLLDQKYGWEKDWKKHFDYLLPFFKDDRYIKVDGKPVVMLYKTAQVACLENMVDLWRELAIQNGLNGMYVIGSEGKMCTRKVLDAVYVHEPISSVRESNTQWKKVTCVNYDEVWQNLLSENLQKPYTIMGFSKYDDTPRHKVRGTVIEGCTAEKFGKYLVQLLAKNEASGTALTFINAWNEWGEGMFLEPDEESNFDYLESVLFAKKNYYKYLTKYEERMIPENKKSVLGRETHLCRVMDLWLSLKEKGVSLSDVLKEQGVSKVAIYGYGILGKHLYRELAETVISVEYVIDRDSKIKEVIDVMLYTPEDILPEVDAIVVTATYAYGDIYSKLKKKGVKKIVSLEHLISEMF